MSWPHFSWTQSRRQGYVNGPEIIHTNMSCLPLSWSRFRPASAVPSSSVYCCHTPRVYKIVLITVFHFIYTAALLK